MSMTQQPWQPLTARLAGTPANETLYDGVPAHLHAPLRTWIVNALQRDGAMKVMMRLQWSNGPEDYRYLPGFLSAEFRSDDELLDVVDAILALGGPWPRVEQFYGPPAQTFENAKAAAIEGLKEMLSVANSVYTVNDSGTGLVRRTDPTAAQAFASATTSAAANTVAGSAADHLRNAWDAVHARVPDPTKAYSQAIKAVEAAAHSVLEPNNSKATLGSMRAAMRQAPAKFDFDLPGSNGSGIQTVIAMISMLWEGQTSRHGGMTPTRDETLAEAKAAVQLAVTLVQWFSAGAVRRLQP